MDLYFYNNETKEQMSKNRKENSFITLQYASGIFLQLLKNYIQHDDKNRRYGQLYPLLNRSSKLSMTNKLILYKKITYLRPIWTYRVELWGAANLPIP